MKKREIKTMNKAKKKKRMNQMSHFWDLIEECLL